MGTDNPGNSTILKAGDVPLEQNDVFLDVGAHKGQEIEKLVLLQVKVIAYEPHPMYYRYLVEQWGDIPTVILHEAAVSDFSGKAKLYFKGDKYADNGGASLLKNKSGISKLNEEVTVVAAHEMMERSKCFIDVMKLNVEGSEYDILWDIINHGFLKHIGRIYVEDHKSRIFFRDKWNERKKQVLDMLDKEGVKLCRWK